jgi:hypothetical protein
MNPKQKEWLSNYVKWDSLRLSIKLGERLGQNPDQIRVMILEQKELAKKLHK